MSRTSTRDRMLTIRSRQSPLNPPLSHTPQKWRQLEDTISEDSDPVPLGGDVTFTFANLPDPSLSNSFTPKGKEWGLPAPQGDDGDSRDGDPLDGGNSDGSDFNDDDDNNNEVDNHLGDVDE